MIIVFIIVYLDACTNGQKVSLTTPPGSKVQYRFGTFSTDDIKIPPFITIFVRYTCLEYTWLLIPCFHYSQYCDRDVRIEAPLCNFVIGAGVFISDVSFSVPQCDDSEDEDFNDTFVQASNCRRPTGMG